MGFFKRMFEGLFGGKQKCSILIVGLDDAGKTTIMNQIMPKKVSVPALSVSAQPCRLSRVLFPDARHCSPCCSTR